MSDALILLLHGRRAGTITRRRGQLALAYDETYRSTPGATPLSVSLPLDLPTHGHRAVDACLRGLLPDNDEVLRRWGRRFHVSAGNPFALLAHVGEDCAGAAQFATEDRASQLDTGGVEWLTEAEVGEQLRELKRDRTSWLPRSETGQFSLAGAQAKTALHRDGSRWGRPWGATPTTHILKPAIEGLDDHDLNEHLSLRTARRLGVPAARTNVAQFDGERVIVVERYDRVYDGSGWRRVHQEDLCQALGLPPDSKYQSEGGPSPESVIALLRSVAGPPVADQMVRRFVDGLALDWILLGTDAHAKNYSLLLSGREVRLAPLYDLASALPYDDLDPHRLRLAMKIGGKYDPAWIGRPEWAELARTAGLDGAGVLARVRQLAEDLPAALEHECTRPDVVDLRSDLPQQLLAAVTARAHDCVTRLADPPTAAPPTRRQISLSERKALARQTAQSKIADLGKKQAAEQRTLAGARGAASRARSEAARQRARVTARTSAVTAASYERAAVRLDEQAAVEDKKAVAAATRLARLAKEQAVVQTRLSRI